MPAILLRGQVPCFRDLWSLHRPMRWTMLQVSQGSGWPPLWNPFRACGQPLAANPHFAVFHPLTWLFYLLPWDAAFRLQIVLPIVLSFAGMLFLLRTLGRTWTAATLGGISWSLGGYGLSLTNLLPVLLTVSPLPWALAFAVRLGRTGSPLSAVLLSASLALSFAGGEPLSMIASVVLVGAAFLHTAAPSHLFRLTSSLAAAMLLAGGLAAATLLPALSFTRTSVRSGAMEEDDVLSWSLPPARLLELLAPPLAGRPLDAVAGWDTWSDFYPGQSSPLVFSLYPGLVVSLLALSRLLGRPRAAAATGVLLVAGVVLALGRHTPMWRVLAATGLMHLARFPEKWVLLVVLPLVLLASRELDELVSGSSRARKGLRLGLVAVLAAAVATFAAADMLGAPAIAALLRFLATVAATQSVVALGLVALARSRPRWSGPLLVVVLACDLAVAGRPLVPSLEPEQHAAPPRLLQPMVGLPLDARLFHLASLHSMARKASADLARPPIPACWGIATFLEKDIDHTLLGWTAEANDLHLRLIRDHPELGVTALRRAGVTAVARLAPQTKGPESVASVTLSWLPPHRPEAYCVAHVVRVPQASDWEGAMVSLGARSLVAAVVTADLPDQVGASPAPCEVEMKSWKPSYLDLRVMAAGPQASFLAFNQTWHSGWTVRIDGEASTLLRRDVSLSAVVVPPGPHRVTLTYDDPFVRWGCRVSVISLALWTLALCLGLASSRRTPPPPGRTRSEVAP